MVPPWLAATPAPAGPRVRPRAAIRGQSQRRARALRHAEGMPGTRRRRFMPCRPRRALASARSASRTRASASASAPSRRWAACSPSTTCSRGAVGEAAHLQPDLRRRHERQASRDHRELRLHHRELGQSRPLGRRRRQAVRQPLHRLPAEVHLGREGSGDPRPRRRGDPRRRRLRRRRRRMPAQVRGERLDHHLRHLVGGLRVGAAQRHARLHRAGARRSCGNGRRGRRTSSCRPASAAWPRP